jgi:hypothetical protein
VWLVRPLIDAIASHVMEAEKLHADDTPVPVPVLAPVALAARLKNVGEHQLCHDHCGLKPFAEPSAHYLPSRLPREASERSKSMAGMWPE